MSEIRKTPKLGRNIIFHLSSCICASQIIVPSLRRDSEQWVTLCTKCAAITKYSRGELKMTFQPLTEFPTFLQFTPDSYVISTYIFSDSIQS